MGSGHKAVINPKIEQLVTNSENCGTKGFSDIAKTLLMKYQCFHQLDCQRKNEVPYCWWECNQTAFSESTLLMETRDIKIFVFFTKWIQQCYNYPKQTRKKIYWGNFHCNINSYTKKMEIGFKVQDWWWFNKFWEIWYMTEYYIATKYYGYALYSYNLKMFIYVLRESNSFPKIHMPNYELHTHTKDEPEESKLIQN